MTTITESRSRTRLDLARSVAARIDMHDRNALAAHRAAQAHGISRDLQRVHCAVRDLNEAQSRAWRVYSVEVFGRSITNEALASIRRRRQFAVAS